MKYTKEEKLNIGRRIYEGELTRYQAAEEYDIGENTARSYMRMYRDLNQLPPKDKNHTAPLSTGKPSGLSTSQNLEAYKDMTKEELIQVLVKARIAEARLKKGYEVKGDGSIIRYSSKNTK